MIVWKVVYWIWSVVWINDFNSYRYVEISYVGIVCIWRIWWVIIWLLYINIYLYISVFRKFFLEILIIIYMYNKFERISGVVLEYVVLIFICIVLVVE